MAFTLMLGDSWSIRASSIIVRIVWSSPSSQCVCNQDRVISRRSQTLCSRLPAREKFQRSRPPTKRGMCNCGALRVTQHNTNWRQSVNVRGSNFFTTFKRNDATATGNRRPRRIYIATAPQFHYKFIKRGFYRARLNYGLKNIQHPEDKYLLTRASLRASGFTNVILLRSTLTMREKIF